MVRVCDPVHLGTHTQIHLFVGSDLVITHQ